RRLCFTVTVVLLRIRTPAALISALALLLAGCAPARTDGGSVRGEARPRGATPGSDADGASLASMLDDASRGDAPADWSSTADDLDPRATPHDAVSTVALLASLQAGIADEARSGADLPPFLEIVCLDSAFAPGPRQNLPAELVAIVAEEIERAKTSEPFFNDVHYGWGFIFGFIGLSPDSTLQILVGWEDFEHRSPMGQAFGLSMDEGVFGQIWDIQHGMAGYSAGVDYFRGTGRTVSDANPFTRRGGYAN
ncbi:MAG: hypothetical protein U0575_17000, partial [Phycisphaerales bacterium]